MNCLLRFYREPFAEPSDAAVIAAGTGEGGVIVFQIPCGSTANFSPHFSQPKL